MTRSESDPQDAVPSKRQRIAKLMARAGLCSRRDAEAWIVDGRVSLNGTILTSPAVGVSSDDAILVDGAPLPVVEMTRLFLFHKPRGLVTTDHDPEGRATVADFLAENWPEGPRVVTVGRLDINTEGLLLLTNDGGLARVLELPQTGWVRRYRVRAKGTADPAALDALAAGVTIDGIDYAGIEAKLDRVQGSNCWLTMGLREGKNREVKRVLEHIGLEVNRLIRLSFGPFQLLDLPEGAVEQVRTRVLRDQLGPTLAAQAGVDFGDTEPAAKPPVQTKVPEPKRREDLVGHAGRGDRPRGDRPPQRRESGRSFELRKPRRDAPDDSPPPKRERPVSGTRKHVSTLRSERTGPKPAGERTRIERTDTRDRRDRTVKVERLVSARGPENENAPRRPPRIRPGHEPAPRDRPARANDTRTRDRDDRRDSRGRAPGTDERGRSRPAEARDGPRRFSAGRSERSRPSPDRRATNRDPDARRDSASAPPRRHGASPSATGKRERIARSGAPRGAASPGSERPGREGAGRRDAADRHGSKPVASDRPPTGRVAKPKSSRPDPAKASRPGKPPAGRPNRSKPGARPDKPRSGKPHATSRRPPGGPSKPGR